MKLNQFAAGVLAAVLCSVGQGALALAFDEEQNGRVLVIRDCDAEVDKANVSCQQQFKSRDCAGGGFCHGVEGVYEGDQAVLRSKLRKRYDAVWLYSGGGSVAAGIEMGIALRQATATVLVPNNVQCISACTIAFMGGLYRDVADARAFRVHSSSALSSTPAEKVSIDIGKYMAEQTSGDESTRRKRAWARFASEQRLRSLFLLSQLLVYFSDMSDPRGKGQEASQQIGRLYTYVSGRPIDFGNTPVERFFLDHRNMTGDDWASANADLIAETQYEGRPLIHRLAMKAERDAASHVIGLMKKSFGPAVRSGWYVPGLDKLQAMYTTTIFDTFDPNPEILKIRGYITTVIGQAK